MRISAAQFVRKFSLLCDEALLQPLILTRHGRERLVVMSMAMYRELTTTPTQRSKPYQNTPPALPSARPENPKRSGNGRSHHRKRSR
jgi:prevent-host-death family protein